MPEHGKEEFNVLDVAQAVKPEEVEAVALIVSVHFLLDKSKVGVEVPVVLNFADRSDCDYGFVVKKYNLVLDFLKFLFDVGNFVFVFLRVFVIRAIDKTVESKLKRIFLIKNGVLVRVLEVRYRLLDLVDKRFRTQKLHC